MASESLNVIALVSGGKDSFFSALHCAANGHRIVALANLHPPTTNVSAERRTSFASARLGPGEASGANASDGTDGEIVGMNVSEQETDLNSFMYQTVGHQVIPLYATATGLPLFRQPIEGSNVQHGLSYQDPPHRQQPAGDNASSTHNAVDSASGPPDPRTEDGTDPSAAAQDETESLVPLLRAVIAAHPEANALCAGAILSTYQRTRVESVALRLGLVPLAYLWQYLALPPPLGSDPLVDNPVTRPKAPLGSDDGCAEDAQLLRDMAAAGLEARIVKVASAGLDEDFLWENVASERSVQRMKRALRRFGGGGRGSVLGEGGEFETLVVDGPAPLFKGRIVVAESGRKIVREGGGSVWLSIRQATVESKSAAELEAAPAPKVRIPELLDPRFRYILDELRAARDEGQAAGRVLREQAILKLKHGAAAVPSIEDWRFVGDASQGSIACQTTEIVANAQQQLRAHSLTVSAITNTVIILRHMSDFPTVNKLYGAMFPEPNPPARVTISSGDLLPPGSDIAIYFTAQLHMELSHRQGLHVQSRSYWAPANIGPYSQAVSFPTRGSGAASSPLMRVVTIAGQIPLVPASMSLPSPPPALSSSSSSLTSETAAAQITLALQHLWRVGVEMQASWWTSAAAYFPRTPAEPEMRRQAILAARAWRSAHLWTRKSGEEEDDDDGGGGPDLWDRKFNPQYMAFTEADESENKCTLPDWEVLAAAAHADDGEAEEAIPFFFAAEVEELPRAAGVEWHAHAGLVKPGPGSVQVGGCTRRLPAAGAGGIGPGAVVELQHVAVTESPPGGDGGGDGGGSGGVVIYTVAAISLESRGDLPPAQFGDVAAAVAEEVQASIQHITTAPGGVPAVAAPAGALPRAYLSYVDVESVTASEAMAGRQGPDVCDAEAIIPCRSLWDARGERLQMAALYRHCFI
ncbi:hypothetical protein BX600DRAFT_432295 [Xylariales sp. PMI_506]|nr:hypothetical protein BX600DRAFT_432295 [Xylariales sp. PMI_506]